MLQQELTQRAKPNWAEVKDSLPKLHAAQSRIKQEAKRFNVLCCGRRFGKDILGHELLIDTALEGKPVAWFAPTYRMMLDTFREISFALQPIATKVNASDHRIELKTGATIDFWSLDSQDSARGRKYARVILNEAAMVAGLETAWNLVIRPTLADLQGDAFFLSTPKGLNFFRTLYSQTGAEWMHWQYPTAANPFIQPTEIEAMRATMPERAFSQEILAQFLEDGGVVFRRIREAATAESQEPQDGRQYVIGVDWARQNDATVFCVIDITAKSVVYLDRMIGVDYNLQRTRLAGLAKRYNHASILAESNSMGLPNIEALQAAGVSITGFETTNATKAQAVDALSLAFETGAIKILNDPILLSELETYEAEKLPSGMIRYSAPEGMHDDCVMALMLAWRAANNRYEVETMPNPFFR